MNRQFMKAAAVVLTVPFALALAGCDLFSSNGAETEFVAKVQPTAEIEVGESLELTWLVSEDDAEVIWLTYDSAIAEVEDGVVTGISAGKVEITLVAESKTSAQDDTSVCEVTVVEKQPPLTIVMSPESFELALGKTVQFVLDSADEDLTANWSSSNTDILTVTETGLVKAVKVGTAKITASTDYGTLTCEITVVEKATNDPDEPEKPDVEDADGAEKAGYTLVWNDEFSGTSLNTNKWGYQTGTQDFWSTDAPGQWGNNEQQYYTEDSVSVADGSLVIKAQRRTAAGSNLPFTSGRILTRRKATFTYGYFEARIQTPAIDGLWPAFWMLPEPTNEGSLTNEYGGWPYSGEIDIMEAKGRLRNVIDCTLHFGPVGTEGPQVWTSRYSSSSYSLNSNTDQWHVYALEWTADSITWYADGVQVKTMNKSEWWTLAENANATSPFDKPFYIILNLAVGGSYDNHDGTELNGVNPPADFQSANMYVDYVRVYEKN